MMQGNADSIAGVAGRVAAVKSTLPQGVELVAVSKFHPLESVIEAARGGQRLFGESRVQELQQKVDMLADVSNAPAIEWHFIGHLQTNKVRQLLRLRPAMIESVDSFRVLDAIDSEAALQGIVQRVLLQVHVAAEDTKTGFAPDELIDYFAHGGYRQLKATHLCGVMGMATNTDDRDRIAADFAAIRDCRDRIAAICDDLVGFDHVSMGMSDDYPLAVEHGATMVRVGSRIFGARQY